MSRYIIGLCGPQEVGKTTIANELQVILAKRSPVTRLRFAGVLKSMLVEFGLTREQVDGGLKETPTPLLAGRTPRIAMRSLGAWGRDYWMPATMARVDAAPGHVIIDDVRFDDEAEAIRARGGFVVELTRLGRAYNPAEPSETGLPSELIDLTVKNDDCFPRICAARAYFLLTAKDPRP